MNDYELKLGLRKEFLRKIRVIFLKGESTNGGKFGDITEVARSHNMDGSGQGSESKLSKFDRLRKLQTLKC